MSLSSILSLLAVTLLSTPVQADSGTVSATPHDSYSSSVGVLGCLVNTNRIAYWPPSVSCNDICIKLTYEDRSVHLLRVDQSQGAHDISYDAWNYLVTGKSATVAPTSGGGIDMQWEDVDASECSDLFNSSDARFPLSASNSMNFLASCLEEEDSYVAQNYMLYNLLDSTCQWGYYETCELVDYPNQNQPTCDHSLGTPIASTDTPVYNIMYPTGQKVKVGDVANSSYTVGGVSSVSSSSSSGSSYSLNGLVSTTQKDNAMLLKPTTVVTVVGAVAWSLFLTL